MDALNSFVTQEKDTLVDLYQANILIVDDDEISSQVAAESLKDFPNVTIVNSGGDAVIHCKNRTPDLLLLDVVLPDLNGYETCKLIKSMPNMHSTPVIFSTSNTDEHSEVACWDAGAADFVAKPIRSSTLNRRIKSHLKIKLITEENAKHCTVDALTGLFNRRYFDEYYESQLKLAQRGDYDLSVIVMDIDYFKRYNDRYGHRAGDECLKSIGSILIDNLNRPTDAAIRYGGEEFVLILPDTDTLGAKHVMNTVFMDIFKANILHEDSPLKRVSISAGIASRKQSAMNDDLFNIADTNLYEAKRTGKSRFI